MILEKVQPRRPQRCIFSKIIAGWPPLPRFGEHALDRVDSFRGRFGQVEEILLEPQRG